MVRLIIALMLLVTPVFAADAPKADAPQADIQGFRSAHFGMTEDEVRKAIASDFGIRGDAVMAEDNALLRTRQMTVKVPDLLPKGGAAQVVYILGYTSSKLIEVDVIWSKEIDQTMKPETLLSNANILLNNFQRQTFPPNGVTVRTPVKEGMVMFRGVDAGKRTVQVALLGNWSEKKGDKMELTPTELRLSYVLDVGKPDVFQLQPGKF